MTRGDTEHFAGTASLVSVDAHTEAPSTQVYFRGYLSNRLEVARALSLEDTSVGEILICGYARWGRDLPRHLDGQFAFALVDRSRSVVLLARDPLGVVPLFWSIEKGVLRFSTRIRDIVTAHARERLNIKEVERYILHGGAATDETVYADIRRLEPGTSIWICKGATARDIVWDPRSIAPVSYSQPQDYVDHFLELVRGSTVAALESGSGSWISLSGGLDSNTLLPPAQQHDCALKAFSLISPQWPEADESIWIERIVAKRGLSWTSINAEEVLPFGELPGTFCGAPDTTVIHRRVHKALNEIVGDGIMITGDGGDSFMGAHMGPVPVHLADPLFEGRLGGLLSELARWREESRPMRSRSYWLWQGLVLPTVRHLLRSSVRPPHYHLHPSWLGFGEGAVSGALRPPHRATAPHCRTPGQQAILDDLWQCAEDGTSFERTYANRHPLFSRPLFEFLWAIPWSQKQLPLCDRYLQRRALRGLLDDDIRVRIGFGMGSRSLVEGLRRSSIWQDYLCDNPCLVGHGLVDKEGWRQAIRQASVGQTGAEPILVRAMATEVWLKQLSDFAPAHTP